MSNNTLNLIDKKYGRLLVLEKTDKRSGTYVIWKCKCDCGKITYVSSRNLVSGHTRSCGCLSREKASNRLKSKDFISAREKYRKNNFLKDGTSLANIKRTKPNKNSKSGIKGVYFEKKAKKWRAKIYVAGKNIELGLYEYIEEAQKARQLAEEKYFKPILEKYSKEQEK